MASPPDPNAVLDAAALAPLELTILDHYSKETRIVVHSFPAIVGRADKADVCVHDPWASHRHCSLNVVRGTLVLRDLGLKNGVFLHGQRVAESNLLPGDRFTVGRTNITVHYQHAAATAESPAQPSGKTPPPPLDPETRELLYGDACDTALPPINRDICEAGFDAYGNGVAADDNPYDQETAANEHFSWKCGWHQAHENAPDESQR